MKSESTTNNIENRSNRAWVAEVVRRIQRGDSVEKNFELLFREYEPRVRRQLRYRGRFGADLDDLVQEVMIRVYRGLGVPRKPSEAPSPKSTRFRLDSSFDTWILRIMSNVAKNAVRDRNTAKARATRASLDSLLDGDGGSGPAMPEPQAPADGPLDAALAAERKTRLATALDRLPARMRQCLLFRYQGYKYREIADAQGVTIATVKKQISHGHRRLRPILGQFVELFGVLMAWILLRQA